MRIHLRPWGKYICDRADLHVTHACLKDDSNIQVIKELLILSRSQQTDEEQAGVRNFRESEH